MTNSYDAGNTERAMRHDLAVAPEGAKAVSKKLAIPPERERVVEAGLRTFQELFAERDRLADALQQEQNRSGMMQIEIDQQAREIADLRTRLSVLEVQRDRDLAEHAVLKTFIFNQKSQLDGMADLLAAPTPEEPTQ